MIILQRKQMNQHQTGGDVLDSPGSTGASTLEIDDPITDPNPKQGEEKKEGDLTNPNPVIPKEGGEEGKQGGETGKQTDGEEEITTHPFQQVAEIIGIDINLADYSDDVNGIAKLVQAGVAKQEGDIQAKVEGRIEKISPMAIELIRWKELNPDKDEREFIATKLDAANIDPATLDEKDTAAHQNILYRNFIKQGWSDAKAKQYAQYSVDANTSYSDAKEILEYNNAQSAKQQAEAIAAKQAEDKRNHEAFVANIESQIATVKGGVLNGVRIPQTEIEPFTDANFMDAGNPEYPGAAAVDIRIANMNAEQRNFLRYLVHKNFDFKGLVEARAATQSISGFLSGKAAGTSKMSGGTSRTGGSDDDRSLDSPGQS